jgi:hypothetical protein
MQRSVSSRDLNTILKISSKEAFTKNFAGTPLMRAGIEGLKRNAKKLQIQ